MSSLLDQTLLSTKDASALSGYNADYLSRLCRSGKITGTQVGRTWLIDRTSLETFVREQEERKQQIAQELSQAREQEYKQAQQVVTRTEKKRTAAPVVSPFTSLVRTPAFAFALSILIMTGSAYAATFGPVGQVVENAGAIALTIQQSVTGINAATPRLRVASNVQTRAAAPRAVAQSTKLLAPTIDAKTIASKLARIDVPDARGEPDSFRMFTYDAAGTKLAALENSRVQTERAFGRFIADKTPLSTRISNTAVAVNSSTRDAYDSVLKSYGISLDRAGNVTLSFAATTRDVAMATPHITNTLLDGYSNAVYAWVNNSNALADNTAQAELATGPAALALLNTAQTQAHAFALAAQTAVDAQVGATQDAVAVATAAVPHTESLAVQVPQPEEAVATPVNFSPFSTSTLLAPGRAVALSTYEFIHSFSQSVQGAYARALALLQGNKNTVAIVPLPPAVTIPGSTVRISTGIAADDTANTTYQGGPLTRITNVSNYFSINGVTKDFVDSAISAALSHGVGGGTTIVNGSGGFSGGSLTASDITDTGDLTLGGTLTSTGPIIAPYFTATSLAATSTFPIISTNSFNIGGNTITNIAGSGLAVVNGVLTATATSSNSFQQGGNTFGASAVLGTLDNNPLSFITNNLARLTIDTSGNVAIGTSTASLLTVGGDVRGDTFTAVGAGTSTLPRLSTSALALGNDYVTGFTGNGLTISAGTLGLDPNNNYFSTTSADAWLEATSSVGTLTAAPNLGTVNTALTGILQANNGVLSVATAGTDYQTPLSFVYPLVKAFGTVNLAFGTTTANTWGPLQTFGSTVTTNATSTTFQTGTLGVGSSYFTSLTGSGLLNSSGVLTLDTSGNWTGTFGGQTASYYLNEANVTGTLAQTHGGTGIASYSPGDILYADNTGTLQTLPVGSTGQVLKVQGGLPAWGVDQTVGSGGSDGIFATSSGLIYPLDTSNILVLGSNVTSTPNSILEVHGQQYISTKLSIATTSAPTQLNVGGSGYFTGGLGIGLLNTAAGTLQTSGNALIGGSLGVGTTSPWAKLSVDATNLGSAPAFAVGSSSRTLLSVSNGGIIDLNPSQLGTATSTLITLNGEKFLSADTGTFNIGAGGVGPQNNLSLGYGALHSIIAAAGSQALGHDNVAIGPYALHDATYVWNNTAIGAFALASSTGDTGGVAGQLNTAVGAYALQQNTTGGSNTALGSGALQFNIAGSGNVALGSSALGLAQNTSGVIAIGSGAGDSFTSDRIQNSIFIGGFAGENVSTTSNDILIGNNSGSTLLTGSENLLIGNSPSLSGAGYITTGSNNIGIGFNTRFRSVTANNQLNIGNFVFGTLPATTSATSLINFPTTGNFGLATTTSALLGLHANNGSLYKNLFAIGSSTSSATTTLFSISNTGVITSAAAATSTFTNGIAVTGGCVSVGGVCLGTGNGSVTSVDASGGTTGLSFSGGPITSSGTLTLAGTLGIANGGTNATAQVSNGVAYYDGTKITTQSTFTFTSSNSQLSIPSNGWYSIGGNLLAYASSTNGAAVFGIGAGGKSATTTNLLSGTTAFGNQALNSLLTNILGPSGVRNTAVGYQALQLATSSNDNTAVGYQALRGLATGVDNTAFGSQALSNNTYGNANTAIGYLALNTNTTGGTNTAVGTHALFSNTTGGANVALGYFALNDSQTAIDTIAIGNGALISSISATNTVAIGSEAGGQQDLTLFNNQGGTFLGYQAGYAHWANNSSFNTIIGYQGGQTLTSGFGNILLGADPDFASNLTSGGNNIGIGYGTIFPSATANNQLNIGNFLFGTLPATTTTFKLPTTGKFAVGSSSPYAKFAIQTNNGDTATTLFAIGSSTASATTTLFSVSNTGVVGIGTSSPSQLLSVQGNGLFSGSLTATGITNNGNALISGGLGVGTTNTTAGTIVTTGSITTGAQFIGLASDGAGTPSFTWSGDLTTGLYHAAANTIGFATAGIGRAVLDASGNFGLGSTTPAAKLSVEGNALIHGSTTIDGFGSGLVKAVNGTLVQAIAGTDYLTSASGVTSIQQTFGSAQTGAITLATSSSNTTGLTIASNITNSGGTFTFSPTLSGTLNLANGGTATTTFYNGGVVFSDGTKLTQAAGSGNNIFTWDNTNGRLGIGSTSPWAQLSVNPNAIGTGPEFAIGSSSATHFVVTNTGKVGIGTSSPFTTFAIADSNGSRQFIFGNGTTNTQLVTASSDSNPAILDLIKSRGTTNTPTTVAQNDFLGTQRYVGYDGSSFLVGSSIRAKVDGAVSTGVIPTDLEFLTGTGGAGALTQRAVITSGGLFGVGTTTPSQLLSVQGNGLFSGNINAANITATGTLATAAFTASGNAQITGGLGVGFSNTTAGTIQTSGSITTGAQFIGLASDGAGAPSFTWAGDLSTGVFHGGANIVGFSTSGIERARVDASGNFGIGSTSPATRLSVEGNALIHGSTTIDGFGSGLVKAVNGTLVQAIAGTDYLTSASGVTSIQQTFGSAQTGAITLATTSSGTTGLTISTNITNSGGTFTFSPALSGTLSTANGGTGTTTYYNGGIVFANASGGPFLSQASGSGNGIFMWDSTNNRLGVGTSTPWAQVSINPSGIGTGPEFAVGSSSATHFVITNAGRVGIGTSTPGALLSIQGTTPSSGNAGIALLVQGATGASLGAGGDITLNTGNGGTGAAGSNGPTTLRGGNFTFTGGTGGANSSTGSTHSGTGGTLTFTGGIGGNNTVGGSFGGDGGSLNLSGGNAGNNSGGGSGFGGNGGSITLSGGNGGTGNTAPGASGGVTLKGGLNGTVVDTSSQPIFAVGGIGSGNGITLTTGSGYGVTTGGGFTFTTGDGKTGGGDSTFTGGAATSTGNGGSFTFTGGIASSTTANAFGGNISLIGGAASSTISSVSGGTITLTGGAGGTGTLTNGSGGNVVLNGGAAGIAGGSVGNVLLATLQGNVGIGTTSPSQLLSVQGNGLFSGNISAANITATGTLAVSGNAQITGGLGIGLSNTTAGTLRTSGSITTGSQFIGLASDGAGAPSFTWAGDLSTGIYHPGANSIGFTTSGIERARFDTSGNFGVATTSPAARLSVEGNALIHGSTTIDGFGSGLVKAVNGTLVQAVAGTDYLTSAITAIGPVGQTQSGPTITFATSTETLPTATGLLDSLTITGSGNTLTFKPTLSGTLNVANGGTGTTTQITNGVNYFDGTKITSGTALTFNGTSLGIGSTSPYVALGVTGTTTSTGGFNVDSNQNLLSYLGSTTISVLGTGNFYAGIGANGSTTKVNGTNNVFIGSNAGYAVTANQNVYIGSFSGFGSTTGAKNSGTNNTAVGYQTLMVNSTGGSNNAFGSLVLTANTIGSQNNGFGSNALTANTTGSSNNAFGQGVLSANTTGSNNSAFGNFALSLNTTGNENVAFGRQTGRPITSGSQNVFLGAQPNPSGAGYITSGNNNIGIGYNALFPSATSDNQLNIGNLLFGIIPATTTASTFGLPTSGSFGVGTSSPFAKFAIQSNNGDTAKTLFAIGSSTASATTTLFSVSNTGIVGIGTSSPQSNTLLSVQGNGLLSGHVAIGNAAGVDQNYQSIFGSSQTQKVPLLVNETYTDLSSTNFLNGNQVIVTANPSGPGNALVFSGDFEAYTKSGNGQNFQTLTSLYAQTSHLGTGTLLDSYGLSSYVTNGSTSPTAAGNTTNAYGVEVAFQQFNYGTTTNAYGVHIDPAINNSNAAAVVNNYGVYIDDQSAVGSTNSYNLYSAGSSAKNYFAGLVGIGTTSPGSLLSIGNSGWNFYDNATSTKSGTGGINITNGCFAVNGTCVGGSSFSNTLANGGTATTTFWNGGVVYSDGTKLTQTTGFTFGGANGQLSIPSNGWYSIGGQLLAYASSSNEITVFGLGAGGQTATTTSAQISGTFIGYQVAKSANISAFDNVGVGVQALSGLTGGAENVAIGDLSFLNVASGTSNTGLGIFAGNAGSRNIAIGFQALTGGTGNDNTTIGYNAGQSVSTGYGNISLGAYAGDIITTGGNNIAIGNYTGFLSGSVNNQLNIGNFLFGTLPATTTTIGSRFANPTSGSLGIGSTSPYAKLSIQTNNGDTAKTLFAIGSSTASATSTLFSVSNTGNAFLSGNFGIGTTTPGSLLSIQGVANFTTATSTFQSTGGINLTNGCYAVNGTCLQNFSNTLANGGTATTTFYNGGVVFSDGSKLTQSAAASNFFWNESTDSLGLGTSTPWAQLSINPNGITGPAFAIGSSTATNFVVTNGGNVGIGTNAPLSRLYIQGSTTNSTNFGLIVTDSTGKANLKVSDRGDLVVDQGISASNGSISAGTYFLSQNPFKADYLLNGGGGDYGQLQNDAVNTWSLSHSSTGGGALGVPVLTWNASNNVGIGSSSPFAKLSINANNGDTNTTLFAIGSSTASATSTLFSVSNIGNAYLSGSFGIGSSSPWAQLSVNPVAGLTGPAFAVGSSSATQFEVDTTGGTGTGLSIQSKAAAGGLTLQTLSTGTNEALTIASKGAGGITLFSNGGSDVLKTSGGNSVIVSATSQTFTNFTTLSTASQVRFGFTGAPDTNLTANTEAPNVYFNLGQTRTHSTGAISVQRDFRLTGSTHDFNTGTSVNNTIASSTVLAIDGVSPAGSLANITNSYAVFINNLSSLNSSTTNAYGLAVQAPTGAVNNYAAEFLNGNVGIGTTSPLRALHVSNAGANSQVLLEDTGASANQHYGAFGFSRGTFTFNTLTDALATTTRFLIDPSGNVGIGTTSPGSLLSIQGVANFTTATTTFQSSGGINITNGCFAINGTCISSGGGSFTNTLANGGTATTTFYSGGLVFSDGSKLTQAANSGVNTLFWDNTNGRLGIGSSSPAWQLAIQGTTGARIKTTTNTANAFVVENSVGTSTLQVDTLDNATSIFSVATSTGSTYFFIDPVGNVGVSTTTPTAQLTTTGTVRFANFGAGTLQTDALGNLSVSSDERLKNINGSFTRGLSEIEGLNPILYHWNAISKFDQSTQYAGFSAQNVQSVIPEAVNTDPRGYLTLQDRPILAAAVNAIKELATTTDALSISTTSLSMRIDNIQAALAAQQAPSAPAIPSSLTLNSLQVNGNAFATTFVAPATPITFTIGSTTGSLPNEVLATDGSGVDLYKAATYAITGVQALQSQTDLLASRLDADELRITMLEAEASSTAQTSSSISFLDILNQLGATIKDGVTHFTSLAFTNLIASPNSMGASPVATSTIPAGAIQLQVGNPLAHPSSEIFVTITSPLQGSWYISQKQEGSFTINLSQLQSQDVTFDYFIVQTEGNTQVASAAAASTGGTVSAGVSTGTSTPSTDASSTPANAPTITLNGDAAVSITQGSFWTDPGATAKAADGTDLTSKIAVTGSVDTNTPGLYTLNYSVVDSNGVTAGVSRVVNVTAAAPAPAPTSGSTPAPATTDTGSTPPPADTTTVTTNTSPSNTVSDAASTPSGG